MLLDNKRLTNVVFTYNMKDETRNISYLELEIILKSLNVSYYVISLEKGLQEETCHWQGYFELETQKTFKTITTALHHAHIERRKGSQQQAIDYCKKQGDYAEELGKETKQNEVYEFGTPKPQKEKAERSDITEFVQAIIDGYDDFDLMLEYPKQYMNYQQKISTVRNTALQREYKNTFRHVEVYYFWGDTGSGKTREVFEKHPDAYKVNAYHSGAFDGYQSQNVLVLEEYHSNFTMSLLLQILDGYPLRLPARYFDKFACFTKVFILSNIPLNEQYPNQDRGTFDSLKRRITAEKHFSKCVSEAISLYGDIVKIKGAELC